MTVVMTTKATRASNKPEHALCLTKLAEITDSDTDKNQTTDTDIKRDTDSTD
jgi:hypothetical protein